MDAHTRVGRLPTSIPKAIAPENGTVTDIVSRFIFRMQVCLNFVRDERWVKFLLKEKKDTKKEIISGILN